MAIPVYESMTYTLPDVEALKARHAELHESWRGAKTGADYLQVIRRWDGLRREAANARSLVDLKRAQDTEDARYRDEKRALDQMDPDLRALDNAFARQVLACPERAELEETIGPQWFRIWEMRLRCFDERIAPLLREEAARRDDYQSLLASASIPFQGSEVNLSALMGNLENPDGEARRAAVAGLAGFLEDKGPELDGIFADLVRVRHAMAQELGFADFRALGYLRMDRSDYGPGQVAAFRDAIREHFVPLAQDVRAAQARRLGTPAVSFADEAILDPLGPPRPQGDAGWLATRFQEIFHAMGEETDSFWHGMRELHLLDLENRKGKAPGGFCTDFLVYRVPFIFQNCTGTIQDIKTLAHEGGHAFQGWCCRDAPVVEYHFPTMEACEVHSMSMEYLVWPWLDRVIAPEDVDRFRIYHLARAITLVPYLAAVDHFQHWVYENPSATPPDRLQAWRDMESLYMPDRTYGDAPALNAGRYWQRQSHIYQSPFYYIDYALAQTCALQVWRMAQENHDTAFGHYMAVCRYGGRGSFLEMLSEGGLRNPMEGGVLQEIAGAVRAWLVTSGGL